MRGQFAAETLDRFVSQTLLNFLATGAAPYLGKWVSQEAEVLLASSSVRGVTAQICENLADTGGRAIGDQTVRTYVFFLCFPSFLFCCVWVPLRRRFLFYHFQRL